ncbi:MAG: DUF1559 domain-containing protein [Planctomycetota bacterium]
MKFKLVLLATVCVAVGFTRNGQVAAEETLASQFPASTVAVVHVDFSKVDVDALAALLPEEARQRFSEQVRGTLGMLSASGITDLYASFDLASLVPPKPVFITNEGAKEKDLLRQLMSQSFQQAYGEQFILDSDVIDGRVYTGSRKDIEKFQFQDGMLDLGDQLSSQRDHVLLLRWDEGTAETLKLFWPPVLNAAPGVTLHPGQLATQLESVRFEFSLPPNDSARLMVRPREAKDTDAVQAELEPLMDLIRKQTGLKIAASETVDSLVWELGPGQTQILAGFLGSIRQSAQKSQVVNDVKQVMLALHNHYSAFNEFPRDVAVDGQALLSWRVKILPFLDQAAFFKSFDMNSAWDSPKNAPLSKIVVPIYSKVESAKTRIRLPLCEGSFWATDDKLTLDKITDGLSNTIAVVVAPDGSVEWSKPGYLQLDEDDLIGSLFDSNDTLVVGLMDGSVKTLSRATMTEEKLRALLTIAGGELVKQ